MIDILSLAIVSILVALVLTWYIICDKMASTRVNYTFPPGCCHCDSSFGRLKYIRISRQWYFLGDNEVLNLLFPFAERTAQVPICEACSYILETREKSAETLSLRIACYLLIPFFIGLWVVLHNFAGAGLLALLSSLLTYLVAFRVLESLPQFAPPAHFTALGKLCFRNKLYHWEFVRLNPNAEVRIPQHQLPVGIFLGTALAVLFSILSDILDIIDATSSKSNNSMATILIVAKALTLPVILRQSRFSVLLWVIVVVVAVVVSPNFSDQIEDVFIGVVLLVIFIYEWWQTQPNGGHSGR